MWSQEYGDLDNEIVVRSHDDVLIWSQNEISMSVRDKVLVMVVIAGKIRVWDQVLVMVVIAGKITVWFWSWVDQDGILLGRLAKRDMVMEI